MSPRPEKQFVYSIFTYSSVAARLRVSSSPLALPQVCVFASAELGARQSQAPGLRAVEAHASPHSTELSDDFKLSVMQGSGP